MHPFRFLKAGITADNMTAMYENAHKKIRADPARAKKEKKEYNTVVKGRRQRLSRQQRQDRVKQKMAAFERKLAAEE
jgi:large subunit ribosomal protein L5e